MFTDPPSLAQQKQEIMAQMKIQPKTNMGSYKGFSGLQRMACHTLILRAVSDGLIPPATECARCGQKEGILQYHNENYDQYMDVERLCWRCHMIHHSDHRCPVACAKYWETIKAGHQWPPVYRHDFTILARDHGIY